MGKASRRKAEHKALKRVNSEQFAQLQDTNPLLHGINPESSDPAVPVAITRELGALFDEAKRTGNIEPPVTLLYTFVNVIPQRSAARPPTSSRA